MTNKKYKFMQSFLFISKNPTKRDTAAVSFAKEQGIDELDITVIERGESEEKKPKLSLGIEDIKRLQKKLFLKPFKGDTKAVILKEAHLLTTEAQNALLKVLEEPPLNTTIILTSESAHSLLPTIRSRCTISDLGYETIAITDDEKKELGDILGGIAEWKVGKALKQAEILAKNKDDAILWLEKMILVTREQMLQQVLVERAETSYHLYLLKTLQNTHRIIKSTNVNLRLALENLLLQITP